MSDVRDQISQFDRDNRLSASMKSIIEGLDQDRQYVHTDANVANVEGGVATNYLLKFQYQHMAALFARNPKLEVRPRKRLGVLSPQSRLNLQTFAESVELLTEDAMKRADLRGVITGAIQDTDTCSHAIIKMSWIADPARDPIGTLRPTDYKDQLATITALLQQRAENPGDFDESSDAQKLNDLVGTMKLQLEGEVWRKIAYPETRQEIIVDPLTGVATVQDQPFATPVENDVRQGAWDGEMPKPQDIESIPSYRAFAFENVPPEDFRVDGLVTTPEGVYNGRWMSHRVYMSEIQIRAFFAVPADQSIFGPDQAASATTSASWWGEGNQSPDMSSERVAIDAAKRDSLFAVWERHDRETGMIYNWVQGGSVYLREPIRPQVRTQRFFPFYILQFNRVSGRRVGISNVTLGRPLQDEINLVRTHKRQSKRAAYDFHIYENELFDDDEVRALRTRPVGGWVPTKKSIEDIREKILPMKGNWSPEPYQVEEEKVELASLVGSSNAQAGITQNGADTATEAAIADQSVDALTEFHRWILESTVLTPIYEDAAQILVQIYPEEVAKARGGPGVIWPLMGREQLLNNMELEIVGGSTGKPNQAAELAKMGKAVEILTAVGFIGMYRPTVRFADQVLAALDIRQSAEDLFELAPPPMVSPPGPGKSFGSPGVPQAPPQGGMPGQALADPNGSQVPTDPLTGNTGPSASTGTPLMQQFDAATQFG
jgi:hypothetical protein